MEWNTSTDTISNNKLFLNSESNTKRQILSTLQSNFDPFGFSIPLLNRARLFVHNLQIDKSLDWDSPIDSARVNEWQRICKQVNRFNKIELPRNVGSRTDEFNLIVYCDASADFVGCTVYLNSVASDECTLILARNSLCTGNLKSKSIPVLELVALEFGVKTLMDVFHNLSNCVRPINIVNLFAYSDSMIALSWLKSRAFDFDKIDQKQVLVNNKLNSIVSMCNDKSVVFDHVHGGDNPSDVVTRALSYNVLSKTKFFTGLKFIDNITEHRVVIPHPKSNPIKLAANSSTTDSTLESVINLSKYSSFSKSVKIMTYVFKFTGKLLSEIRNTPIAPVNYYVRSSNYLITQAQRASFPRVVDKLSTGQFDDPLITQLNLFIDDTRIVRINSKLKKLNASYDQRCPVLLDKNCPIARSIIQDTHNNNGHCGVYKTLNLIRQNFWVTNAFITIKKIVKQCFTCCRWNNRTLKLSQNAYADFRVNPECVRLSETS